MPDYIKRARRLLTDTQRAAMEESIAENPEIHPVVAQTGGVRKVRWSRTGMGKRGGVRAVYLFVTGKGTVYMLDIYGKHEKPDLTPDDRRRLRKLVAALRQE